MFFYLRMYVWSSNRAYVIDGGNLLRQIRLSLCGMPAGRARTDLCGCMGFADHPRNS